MRVQITKRADGSGVLRCIRPHGSGKRGELFQHWAAVAAGATLELQYEAALFLEPNA